MPVSKELLYQWYDTPNVHHCTLVDFETLCAKLGLRILERLVLTNGDTATFLPNLLGNPLKLSTDRCIHPALDVCTYRYMLSPAGTCRPNLIRWPSADRLGPVIQAANSILALASAVSR